jgi:threonylcarbamoyladenosine tRNA methylthiotransferase MtaB
MPQLAREVVKARASRLRGAAAERRNHWLDSLAGTTLPALVEGSGIGHTDNFAPFDLPGACRGESGKIRVTGRIGDHVTAVWA